MGYIYCITNLINRKQYVGKTTNTIEERFKEHCRDSRKERCNRRPLYDAMNKYGIENFKIEELEQVDDPTLLSSKEKYWIKELNIGDILDIMLLREAMVKFFMTIKKLLIYIVWVIPRNKQLKRQDAVMIQFLKY